MFSEFTIGRRSGANAFGAYKILAPKSKWGIVGILAVLTPTLVVSFYSVVGGWTIDYMVKAAMSRFSMGSEGLGTLFSDTISEPSMGTASPFSVFVPPGATGGRAVETCINLYIKLLKI